MKPTRKANTPGRMASLSLCASLVFAMPMSQGQDLEAVERKLGEAVAEGNLSLEHAVAMMETLHEITDHEHHGNVEERIEGWIHDVGEEIKAAAREGDLSEDEAWEKWHHFKEHELAPKLKDAVADELVSEEWARELWEGIEKVEIGERLKGAVARGEMTEDEAWAEWEELTGKKNNNEMEPWMEETMDRFRREVAERSPKENRRELEELVQALKKAQKEGDEERKKILAAEILLIKEALAERKNGRED